MAAEPKCNIAKVKDIDKADKFFKKMQRAVCILFSWYKKVMVFLPHESEEGIKKGVANISILQIMLTEEALELIAENSLSPLP